MLVRDQQGVDSCQALCMNLHVHRRRNRVRPCQGHDTKIGHQDEVLLWHDSVNYAEATIGITTRTYLRAHGSSSCSISRRALLIQYTSCERQTTFANRLQTSVQVVHSRQGGLGHTSWQAVDELDPAGADFPAAHCTDSQACQDIIWHAGQEDAQLHTGYMQTTS